MDDRKKSKQQLIGELRELRKRVEEFEELNPAPGIGAGPGIVQARVMQALLNGASVGIVVSDGEGRIVLCNTASDEMFGYSQEELLGLQIEALIPEPLRRAHVEHHSRFLSDPRPRSMGQGRDLSCQRKDGTSFPAEIGLGILRINHETYVVSFIADITERKRTEDSLRNNLDRLKLLHKLDQAILAAQSPEAIAQVALEHIQGLVPFQQASIVMFDLGTDEYVVLSAQGIDEPRAEPGSRLPLEDVDIPEDFLQGKVEVVEDASSLPHPLYPFQVLKMEGLRSYLHVPLFLKDVLFGALNLGSSRKSAFSEDQIEIALEVADVLAIAIQQAWLFEQVRGGRDRLQRLARELVEAQENERRRIARELHDEIGQLLTGLKLTVEMSLSLPFEEAKNRLAEAEELVRELILRLRDLSLDLHPAMLDDLGLLQTLEWHFERYRVQTGIQVDFEHSGLETRFPPLLGAASYRIVQEALTNVARHAGVDEVKVTAYSDGHVLGLQIEDQGRGFDPKAVWSRAGTSGLTGMRERASALGGTLMIESTPGVYTKLFAELPLSGHLERRMVDRRI